jgi:hypothetical protein
MASAGHLFTGPASPQYCGENHGADACLNWVGGVRVRLRQDLTYQPAGHFWLLQFTEIGIFLAVAGTTLLRCGSARRRAMGVSM